MANNSRRFLKIITEHFHKSPFLNNASTALGNASEKAHEKIANMQNVATEKYGDIVKVLFNLIYFKILGFSHFLIYLDICIFQNEKVTSELFLPFTG